MQHNKTMDANQHNQPQTMTITSQQFAAKFKSKREVYMLLTVEAGKYLPPCDACTIYYLKDIIAGRKRSK